MREITQKLYSIDELSEKARLIAIKRYVENELNDDFSLDAEYMVEEVQRELEAIGFSEPKLYYSICDRSSCTHFTFTHFKASGTEQELYTAVKDLYPIVKDMKLEYQGVCVVRGCYQDVSIGYYVDGQEDPTDELVNFRSACRDAMIALGQWFESAYFDMMKNEYAIERLRYSEFEFYENGTKY